MKKSLQKLIVWALIIISLISNPFSHTYAFNQIQVIVGISFGTISLWSPTTLTFNTTPTVSYDTGSIEQLFSGSDSMLYVEDKKGFASGYSTTLQLSGAFTSTGGATINASNFQFKAYDTGVILMSGNANTGVVIDNNAAAYQALNTPRVYIYRDGSATDVPIGRYGQNVWFKITFPPGQVGGQYVGYIIYTIFEN